MLAVSFFFWVCMCQLGQLHRAGDCSSDSIVSRKAAPCWLEAAWKPLGETAVGSTNVWSAWHRELFQFGVGAAVPTLGVYTMSEIVLVLPKTSFCEIILVFTSFALHCQLSRAAPKWVICTYCCCSALLDVSVPSPVSLLQIDEHSSLHLEK